MTMDPTPLREAFRTLLAAAAADAFLAPPDGEWDADQILAHVVLVNAATIGVVAAVASGAVTTYDNRLAQDRWTIARVVGLGGLRDRVRAQGEALCALGPTLTDPELDTTMPALLLSNGTALVDQPLRLRDILSGLADVEVPGHTRQLLALRATV